MRDIKRIVVCERTINAAAVLPQQLRVKEHAHAAADRDKLRNALDEFDVLIKADRLHRAKLQFRFFFFSFHYHFALIDGIGRRRAVETWERATTRWRCCRPKRRGATTLRRSTNGARRATRLMSGSSVASSRASSARLPTCSTRFTVCISLPFLAVCERKG
jgi:hypothetical protein